MAASRLIALNPLGASAMFVLLTNCTIRLPIFCNTFFMTEKDSMSSIGLIPIVISALPARIGAVRAGISAALYWLSASVLTITSAPSPMQAFSPARKAALPCDFLSVVRAAVVDDEPFHAAEPGHCAR